MSELDPKAQPARTVVRAAAAAIPGIGGPVAVVLEDVWLPAWQRNVRDFIEHLGSDVQEMASELYSNVAELQDKLSDERVAEVFHRSAQTARIASSAATRRRCRAAVLSAIRQPERSSMNLRFVRLIEELTPAHFTLLAFLQEPAANEEYQTQVGMASVTSVAIGAVAPAATALGYSEEFLRMLSADLQRLGLGELPSAMMSGQGVLAKRSTDLGDQLLDFVRHPVAGDRDSRE